MPEFKVDLESPKSVDGALKRAELLATQALEDVRLAVAKADKARQDAQAAEAELERCQSLVATLQNIRRLMTAAPPRSPVADEGSESSMARALAIVTAINSPTNIGEVAEQMPEINRKTVSWALWKLADDEAIQKLGRGRYAPKGYTPGTPTTHYLKIPATLPAPSAGHIGVSADAGSAFPNRRHDADT